MKKKIPLPKPYEPFIATEPRKDGFQFVDATRYLSPEVANKPQPKTPILDASGRATGFFGLPLPDPAKNWVELMANDTTTRELTPDEFKEWARRSHWTTTSPNWIYRSCPHQYCVSQYEDTRQRLEFECAAKTIVGQGRGMIFGSSQNVWSYFFPGDGYYYWQMDTCWKESTLINRAEIATTNFFRKKNDPVFYNGRDDEVVRTFTDCMFLEKHSIFGLAPIRYGVVPPIEVRRFGDDEVRIHDYETAAKQPDKTTASFFK